MTIACPEVEELEQFAADASGAAPPVREHLSACAACQARLHELSENLALFAELGSATGGGLTLGSAATAATPQRIAEYAIVREIGRGGMGVVYEARQQRPERRVALKLLRADHMRSVERRRLFEREIQVLARLRHPGITAIFGAGASDAGPYYAMELLEGVSLTEYAQQTAPDLRSRLELFRRLCAAVSYAHQHGVIHRDLKPTNVLIESGGHPKVLDFGLARMTDVDVTGPSLAMDGNRLVGTLAYMSPEQTRGVADEIDVRSDVYSLGVMLFELLTGTLPYDVPRTSVMTAVRSICESPPRRPSRAQAAIGIDRRALEGDLDTIVIKALEKQPEARYQSVAALSEDIERYLGDQPIVARPATTIYQFRKFARRNRALVGGALGVFLALGLGLVATAWQAHRARAAERQALVESATNAEISRFLATMFTSVDPGADGPSVRVVQLLDRAAMDVDRSFEQQPRVAMALREAIGNAYRSLMIYREAAPQLSRALTLATQELGAESREALRLRSAFAEATAHTDRIDAAMIELKRTLEAQHRLFGADDPDTLATKNLVAIFTAVEGRHDEAEAMLREVISGRTRSLGRDHEKTLETLASLGVLLGEQDRRDEARALLQEAYDTSVRARGPDHAQSILFANHIAVLARTPQELEAVEPIYRDIVERSKRVYGPDHLQTIGMMGSLGQLLELRCNFEESVAVTTDLLERQRRAAGERHVTTIDVLGALVRRYRLAGMSDQAEAAGRRHLALCREVLGESDSRTLESMFQLVHVLHKSGQLIEANDLVDEVLSRRVAATGESSLDTALARTLKADILREMGRLEEARNAAERAGRDLGAAPNAHALHKAWAAASLGACLRDLGRLADAEPLLVDSYQSFATHADTCHPATIETCQQVVELYERWQAADPEGGQDAKLREWTDRCGRARESAAPPGGTAPDEPA